MINLLYIFLTRHAKKITVVFYMYSMRIYLIPNTVLLDSKYCKTSLKNLPSTVLLLNMSTQTALCTELTMAHCTFVVFFVVIMTSFVCAHTLSTRKMFFAHIAFIFFHM